MAKESERLKLVTSPQQQCNWEQTHSKRTDKWLWQPKQITCKATGHTDGMAVLSSRRV